MDKIRNIAIIAHVNRGKTGIPIVAAVSAPSSLAVEFARDSNQTLIGFLRPPSFNIYSHIERVIF
jgi:FdhD protein